MARRRRSRQTYAVGRSAAYDVPHMQFTDAPDSVSAFQQPDVSYIPDAVDTVYPWYRQTPLRVYMPSPYRHERSEFKRRVSPLSLTLERLQVFNAREVDFCRQRKVRRSILFAHGVAGRRGRQRRRRWRESSNWRC